jgi:ATP-dependent RNA helicase DBP3
MSQQARTQALSDFKTGVTTLLVATDVAARGLDIPKVELVINQTFPLTIEDYIHRIGRTGRAGRKGKAITFFTAEDSARAGELQRVLREGGMEIPEALKAFGGTIKKKVHATYGAHYNEELAGAWLSSLGGCELTPRCRQEGDEDHLRLSSLTLSSRVG